MSQEYEVEEILAQSKGPQGEELFQVKWKGYSVDEATWEPVDNLQSAMTKVSAFLGKRSAVQSTVLLEPPKKKKNIVQASHLLDSSV